MRKLYGYALVGAMALTITACGGGAKETTPAETTTAVETTLEETTEAETTVEETTEESTEETTAEVEETETEAGVDNETPEAGAEGTLGDALVADFEELLAANADATAQELADGVLANEMILFSGITMPMEAGLLTGFGNTEITDFDECVMFGPMISSIPFIGYVFDTADAATAETLAAFLAEEANPAWNICTEADQTMIKTIEDKVFFVMCPASIEE